MKDDRNTEKAVGCEDPKMRECEFWLLGEF
jgi:hypothetical protein